ncbi:hypothetical protein PAPHI01_1878 [Pancytospora philotis]|nr:hypothetical protein PAPHI01_1878 [Pancytospora philotis]
MRVTTGMKSYVNGPDSLVHEKKRKVEVGIAGQGRLHTVGTVKVWKYDVLVDKLKHEMQYKTETISHMMTWGGVVTSL